MFYIQHGNSNYSAKTALEIISLSIVRPEPIYRFHMSAIRHDRQKNHRIRSPRKHFGDNKNA